MNGFKVGNRTFPDTPQGRLQAQEYARKNKLRVETNAPRVTPTPGQTPAQRQIEERKRAQAQQQRTPPKRW